MSRVQFDEPGQAALEHWIHALEILMFLPKPVTGAVETLRHAVVYRRHGELDIETLETALKLPFLLGNRTCYEQIQWVYKVIRYPHMASTKDKAKANRLINKYRYPIITQNDLLSGIQQRLEHSCFRFARRHNLLSQDTEDFYVTRWDSPAKVELQRWQEYFQTIKTQQDQSSFAQFPPKGRRYQNL